ncbi:membrane-associated tyrosine- and threonine-specific cdc2-inhibitory kinase-like [Lineus longissimus]|uniref:membrane-associated tyrosine- and threonine-specific cdc2-inhibitory kinase-like n=1 Tax=Lineus longissimus TaxID=88925 RepID=UPI002B4CD37A
MATIRTPRPTPKFFREAQTFSTKKERGTPREAPPPKPPVKSAPPVSRIYQHRPILHAQRVSFKHENNNTHLLSPHYDEMSKDLYFDQCFQIECKLGVGSFGEVFKVKSKEDGKFYAIKRSRERFRGESDRRRKLEEVAKHEQLPKHPNCVAFFKAWEERQHLYIQTELCHTCLSNLSEMYHDIPEAIIWNYLVDLLMAVKHLHDHDLVHMDIKPENIFIMDDGTCKLGDFGLVLDLSKGTDYSEAQEGDPRYMAPELLQGKFSKAADVFSLGISIMELACDLDLPKGGEGWHQLRNQQMPREFMKGMSEDLQYVLRKMLKPDERLRPSVDDVLGEAVIHAVWKRRKRQRILKHIYSFTANFFMSILSLLIWVWLHVTRPLHRLIPDRLCTPQKHPHSSHPSDWDYSFSDDDLLDAEDCINVSNNSMGVPLDTSTSSETDTSFNGGFKVPSIPHRRAVTSPGLRSRQITSLTPKNSSPIHQLYSSASKLTSSERLNSSFNSDSSCSPNNSFTDDRDDENKNKPIGPKNLISIFEAASGE